MGRGIVDLEHVATIVIGCMVAGALVFVPRRRWGLFSYPKSRPLISTSFISPILPRYPVFSRLLAFAVIAIEVGIAGNGDAHTSFAGNVGFAQERRVRITSYCSSDPDISDSGVIFKLGRGCQAVALLASANKTR